MRLLRGILFSRIYRNHATQKLPKIIPPSFAKTNVPRWSETSPLSILFPSPQQEEEEEDRIQPVWDVLKFRQSHTNFSLGLLPLIAWRELA